MNVSMNTATLPDMTVQQMEYAKKADNVQKKESVEKSEIRTGKVILDRKYFEANEKYLNNGFEKFCSGELSLEDLKNIFVTNIKNNLNIHRELSSDKSEEDVLLSSYGGICNRITTIAERENSLEGIEIAEKHGFDRSTMNIDFVYYNADYYYKWEEATRLAGECVDLVAKQLELKDFERKNDLCNFNRRWGSNYGKIINAEAVPPKGFKLFYRDRIIDNPADRSGNSAIYYTTMIVNGNSVVGEKEIPMPENGILQNYLERNQYFYPAVNAYDYYMEQGFGGEDGACGFLKNIIIYSKNRMYTRGLESGESDQSYMKISYRSKMFQYMKLL